MDYVKKKNLNEYFEITCLLKPTFLSMNVNIVCFFIVDHISINS